VQARLSFAWLDVPWQEFARLQHEAVLHLGGILPPALAPTSCVTRAGAAARPILAAIAAQRVVFAPLHGGLAAPFPGDFRPLYPSRGRTPATTNALFLVTIETRSDMIRTSFDLVWPQIHPPSWSSAVKLRGEIAPNHPPRMEAFSSSTGGRQGRSGEFAPTTRSSAADRGPGFFNPQSAIRNQQIVKDQRQCMSH
jgi:hypothetical protein